MVAPDPRSQRAATLNALAAIGLWGTLAVLALKLQKVPPFLLLGYAFLLGALCGARGLRVRELRPSILLVGVYGLFAYHLCLFLALRLAPPVEANLINYLWPLLIVVLSPLFAPGTTLRPRHYAGALLGFGGAALLVTGGHLSLSADGTRGYLLALAAAVIWSTYSLLSRRAGAFPTSAISAFCALSGVLALFCHAYLEPAYALTAGEIPYLLVIGLGPMGAAFYVWDRALKRGDPRVVGTLAYLTPLLSTALLAAFGGAPLTGLSLAAMGLIICGAVIGSWSPKPPPSPAATNLERQAFP